MNDLDVPVPVTVRVSSAAHRIWQGSGVQIPTSERRSCRYEALSGVERTLRVEQQPSGPATQASSRTLHISPAAGGFIGPRTGAEPLTP